MDHRHPVTRHYCIFELLHEGNVSPCIWVRSDYFLKSVMKAVMSSHFYKIKRFWRWENTLLFRTATPTLASLNGWRHCKSQFLIFIWLVLLCDFALWHIQWQGDLQEAFVFDWHVQIFPKSFADLRCTEICQRHLFTAETCIATFLNQKQRIQYSRFYAGQ